MKYVLFLLLMAISVSSFSQSKEKTADKKQSAFIENAHNAFATIEQEQAQALKPQLSNVIAKNINFDSTLLNGTSALSNDTASTPGELMKKNMGQLKNMNAGPALFEIMYPEKDTAIFTIDNGGKSYFVGSVDVDGASTNKAAYDAGGGTTIDFSKSNMAYTSSSPTSFTLEGIKDGGTYTLAVQGGAAGLASFSSSGLTFKSKNNGPTQADTDTLYTFLVFGTTVYYSMITGL